MEVPDRQQLCFARFKPISCRRRLTLEAVPVAETVVGNVDVTIIAQAPKMRPHIDAMRTNIATDLEIDMAATNVKATTTEKLGFTGRKEGIAVEAVALLYRDNL